MSDRKALTVESLGWHCQVRIKFCCRRNGTMREIRKERIEKLAVRFCLLLIAVRMVLSWEGRKTGK